MKYINSYKIFESKLYSELSDHGAEDIEDTDEDFETKMLGLTTKLSEQMAEGVELDKLIKKNLQGLGYVV